MVNSFIGTEIESLVGLSDFWWQLQVACNGERDEFSIPTKSRAFLYVTVTLITVIVCPFSHEGQWNKRGVTAVFPPPTGSHGCCCSLFLQFGQA